MIPLLPNRFRKLPFLATDPINKSSLLYEPRIDKSNLQVGYYDTELTTDIQVGTTLCIELNKHPVHSHQKNVFQNFYTSGSRSFAPFITNTKEDLHENRVPEEYRLMVKYDLAISLSVACELLQQFLFLPTRIVNYTNLHMARKLKQNGLLLTNPCNIRVEKYRVALITKTRSLKAVKVTSSLRAEELAQRWWKSQKI